MPLVFLGVEGEMADLIRRFDWAATALGPPEAWPTPLRTMVHMALTTRHPVFLMWGPELHCLYNDAYRQSLGPEQHPAILGAPGREAWADIWPLIGPELEQVMAGGRSTWHENQLVAFERHGRREPIYWTYGYSPIFDDAAPTRVGGVLVLCTETTEQVLARQAAVDAQRRWQRLFDQSPGIIAVLRGPEHRYEYVNPACLRLLHRDDVVGRTVAEVLPELVGQGYIDMLDQVYASGHHSAHCDAVVDILPAPGQPLQRHHVDFVYAPIREADGTVGGVLAHGHDVTERWRSAQALAASQRERDAALSLLQTATAAAQLGIHAWDLESGVIGWDARTRQLWGVGPDVRIDYDFFMASLHPDDRLPTQQAVDQAMDPHGDGRYVAEYRVLRADAAPTWIRATGVFTFVEARAASLTGTVQDITAQKVAEAGLRDADRRKDEFLATLSHELRNPLAPIRNAASALGHPHLSPRDQKRSRDIIVRQTAHMARLLDDLLDVARIAQGKIDLQRAAVSVQSAIESALEVTEPMVRERRHTLTFTHPDAPVWVHADPVRLAQMVTNLLTNAVKYTPEGGRITVSVQCIDVRVRIGVEDNGVGLPPDALHGIFDMFSQVQSARQLADGGLGIGLALVKQLALLHGGDVEARSPGRGLGSEFIVHLPVVDGEALRPPAVHQAAPEALSRRVMVIDDNADAATMMAMYLRLKGHEVIVADSAAEALLQADTFVPECACIDLSLPDVDGIALCRLLRLRLADRGLRCAAVTGWSGAAHREAALQAGFEIHFTKPVDMEELDQWLVQGRGA